MHKVVCEVLPCTHLSSTFALLGARREMTFVVLPCCTQPGKGKKLVEIFVHLQSLSWACTQLLSEALIGINSEYSEQKLKQIIPVSIMRSTFAKRETLNLSSCADNRTDTKIPNSTKKNVLKKMVDSGF